MLNNTFDYEVWKSEFRELHNALAAIPWKSVEPSNGLTALNGPFLSFPKPVFLKQERRLLIFGQETYGWWGSGYNERATEEVLKTAFDCYNQFFFTEESVETRSKARRSYYAVNNPSPFWRAFRKAAGNEYRNAVWCNLMPFDCFHEGHNVAPSLITHHSGTKEHDFAWEVARSLVSVYIKQLNPTHILFFTGPNYDHVIKEMIPDVKFADREESTFSLPVSFGKRSVAIETLREVRIGGITSKALRTYHPNSMSMSGAWSRFLPTLQQFMDNP
jgi:hypothetical protein